MKPKHIKAYIAQCLAISECSVCPRAKFGCVIVEPETNTTKISAYNGPSRGLEGLCGGLKCLRDELGCISGEDLATGCHHAESNAVCLAARNGMALDSCIAFVSGEPCLMCSKMLYHAGIYRVIVIKGNYTSMEGVKFLKERDVLVERADKNGNTSPYLTLDEIKLTDEELAKCEEIREKMIKSLEDEFYKEENDGLINTKFVRVGQGITELTGDFE